MLREETEKGNLWLLLILQELQEEKLEDICNENCLFNNERMGGKGGLVYDARNLLRSDCKKELGLKRDATSRLHAQGFHGEEDGLSLIP